MMRLIRALWLCLLTSGAFAVSKASGENRTLGSSELAAATDVHTEGATVSDVNYQGAGWHPIRRMPATVLEILQEDGVDPNLYVGQNMVKNVPQDLYQQDWWYRMSSPRPRGTPSTRWSSRELTTARKSGSMATR